MASNKTLNAKILEALGAARLAKLLLEISTGNAAAKRRLRLELAGAESPGEVAKEIRKRLTTIARSRSFVEIGRTGGRWSTTWKRSAAPSSSRLRNPIPLRVGRAGTGMPLATSCGSLASSILDFGTSETHEAYVARLKAEHGRKSSFWSLIS